jgi:retinol dehydrogenase 14
MRKQDMPIAALITGGTEGIGKAGAAGLLHRKAVDLLFIVGRDSQKGGKVVAELEGLASHPVKFEFIAADLSLLSEAARIADIVSQATPELRYLVHSAGVILPTRQMTAEGEDASFAVNYLSRFVLTEKLMPLLKAGRPSRVLIIGGHSLNGRVNFDDPTLESRWTALRALGQYQRANYIYAVEAARRFAGTGVTVNVVAPGIVDTGIRRQVGVMRLLNPLLRPFMRTPERAAEDVVAHLMDSAYDDRSGELYSGVKPMKIKPDIVSEDNGRRLWELSERCAEHAGIV